MYQYIILDKKGYNIKHLRLKNSDKMQKLALLFIECYFFLAKNDFLL